MTDDQTLADQAGDTPFGNPNGPVTPPRPQLETLLDLDEVMSQARLVERTARICLRGDLVAIYQDTLDELSTLVDEHGAPLGNGDEALSETSRVQELSERARTVRAEMATATRRVLFRAMPDDEWVVFEKQHHPKTNDADFTDFNNKIIARCAIAPTMTEARVQELRSKLGPVQMTALANAAFIACTTGGLDVPKSPSFLLAPKPQASEKN